MSGANLFSSTATPSAATAGAATAAAASDGSTGEHSPTALVSMSVSSGSEQSKLNADTAVSSMQVMHQAHSSTATVSRRRRRRKHSEDESQSVRAAAREDKKSEVVEEDENAAAASKRRKMQQGVSTKSDSATASAGAAIAGSTLTLLSLHTVERQLIMHYLDATSTLRFARTCKRIYADALHFFPHMYQPHFSIDCSDEALVECYLRSSLLRHFPALEVIVDNEAAIALNDGNKSFERLLASGLVQAVTVSTWNLEVPTVLGNFLSALQSSQHSARNIRSLFLHIVHSQSRTGESEMHSVPAIVRAIVSRLHGL